MRRLVKLLKIAMLVTLLGCSSPKMTNKFPMVEINQDLSHWIVIDSDSVFNMKNRNMDSKIGDYNLKRLQDYLDKDKDSPYWGESIYYMLQDLFKK